MGVSPSGTLPAIEGTRSRSWRCFEGRNCWNGHGGENANLQQDNATPRKMSVEQAMRECELKSYAGFTYEEGAGRMWRLRSIDNPSAFTYNKKYKVYMFASRSGRRSPRRAQPRLASCFEKDMVGCPKSTKTTSIVGLIEQEMQDKHGLQGGLDKRGENWITFGIGSAGGSISGSPKVGADLGKLDGVKHDLEDMAYYANKYNIKVGSVCGDALGVCCEDILKKIADIMKIAETGGWNLALYYTGHGAKHTGDWCFLDGTISLEEVATRKLNHMGTDLQLVIVSDACYSGCWVQECIKKYKDGQCTARCNDYNIDCVSSSAAGKPSYDRLFARGFWRGWDQELALGPAPWKSCGFDGSKEMSAADMKRCWFVHGKRWMAQDSGWRP